MERECVDGGTTDIGWLNECGKGSHRHISSWDSNARCNEILGKAFQCHFVYHISQPCRTLYALRPAHMANDHGTHCIFTYAKCLQINGDAVPGNRIVSFRYWRERVRRKNEKKYTYAECLYCAPSLCYIYGGVYNLEHSRVNLTSLRSKMIHNDVIK